VSKPEWNISAGEQHDGSNPSKFDKLHIPCMRVTVLHVPDGQKSTSVRKPQEFPNHVDSRTDADDFTVTDCRIPRVAIAFRVIRIR
jgi:hypothetical protein